VSDFDFSAVNEMFDPSVELDPRLVPWLDESDFLGTCLRHPLVYQVPYHPHFAKMANRAFEYKGRRLDEALEEEDWHTVVFLHERPYRPQAMRDYILRNRLVDDATYWGLVGEVWQDTEYPAHQTANWRALLGSKRPERPKMMDNLERTYLGMLPPSFTVYRGVNDRRYARGFSWTLDRERAEWFARRFSHDGRSPHLVTGTVARADVIAYLGGRGEQEILVRPRDVHGVSVSTIKPAG
jgi:hypothetical protein